MDSDTRVEWFSAKPYARQSFFDVLQLRDWQKVLQNRFLLAIV